MLYIVLSRMEGYVSRMSVTVVAECEDGQVIALNEQSGRLFKGSADAMSALDFGGSVLTTMNNESTYFTGEGDFFVNRSNYQLTTATWNGRSVNLLNAEGFDIVEDDRGVFKLTDKVIDYSI